MTWFTLPPISTAKSTVTHSSFIYVGKNRIVYVKGIERRHLKGVRILQYTLILKLAFKVNLDKLFSLF